MPKTEIRCEVVLPKGKRKGELCGKPAYKGSEGGLCYIHWATRDYQAEKKAARRRADEP